MKRPLFDIVNYRSGDSWNGTHDRWIDITYRDERNILVENVYNAQRIGEVFTLDEICEQLPLLGAAGYFEDFCYQAAQNVPTLRVVLDEQGKIAGVARMETPAMAGAAVEAGLAQRLTPCRPLKLKPRR